MLTLSIWELSHKTDGENEMSYSLLKRKLELETELAGINEKLKAKATSGSNEHFNTKGLTLKITWVKDHLKFDRSSFENDNPELVNLIRSYCTDAPGHHRMGKVKRVKKA